VPDHLVPRYEETKVDGSPGEEVVVIAALTRRPFDAVRGVSCVDSLVQQADHGVLATAHEEVGGDTDLAHALTFG
jgi:hypothetical protein